MGSAWIDEERHDAGGRDQLVQQFESLLRDFYGQLVTPVTLPPGRFRLVTRPSWIGSLGVVEDNRNFSRGRFCRKRSRRASCGNDCHLTMHKISYHGRQSTGLILGPAVFY